MIPIRQVLLAGGLVDTQTGYSGIALQGADAVQLPLQKAQDVEGGKEDFADAVQLPLLKAQDAEGGKEEFAGVQCFDSAGGRPSEMYVRDDADVPELCDAIKDSMLLQSLQKTLTAEEAAEVMKTVERIEADHEKMSYYIEHSNRPGSLKNSGKVERAKELLRRYQELVPWERQNRTETFDGDRVKRLCEHIDAYFTNPEFFPNSYGNLFQKLKSNKDKQGLRQRLDILKREIFKPLAQQHGDWIRVKGKTYTIQRDESLALILKFWPQFLLASNSAYQLALLGPLWRLIIRDGDRLLSLMRRHLERKY